MKTHSNTKYECHIMINPFLFKFDVDSNLRINIALHLFHDHFDKQIAVSGLLIINRIQYSLVQ